ncbi:hypothetical protein [Leeuwenhoekiella marinoflava]|uniref:Uncharacterized protein n=2 Tax=Leeuwenhoekiella marinoflava TaxID=988 RepID=A0A4Q0PI88_9FLAO|nr:hypothetical protein [Leeuwenhoekiella marinoflava]RXG26784.1 hypothetical protein DSL99_3326 [Leeuwenhoekiella marinoflava]SHF81317.1 hypothetical protein SAMN02745246_03444 [Leeuwenhoekiella marinoflava DSM 3653]
METTTEEDIEKELKDFFSTDSKYFEESQKQLNTLIALNGLYKSSGNAEYYKSKVKEEFDRIYLTM